MIASCATALAPAAVAKTGGTPGRLIAFERAGDIRLMSDHVPGQPDARVDLNLTNSPGAFDGAPSWGLPDQSDGCVIGDPNDPTYLCRSLAYESRPTGADSDIILATLAGATPSLVSSRNLTAASNADDGAPALALQRQAGEDTPVVAFTRGPVGQRDVWVADLNGVEAQLTATPADERSPDWSQLADAVVYETADAAGRRQLAIIDVGPAQQGFVHGAARLVTAGPEQHGDPSWYDNPRSPAISDKVDPSRLLHVSTASGTTYLDYLEQDPGTLTAGPLFAPASAPAVLVRQLTGDPGGDLAPSWSPEGDYVVFESDRAQAGNRDIYRVNADGTGLVRLTSDAAPDQAPDWEPYRSGYPLDPEPYSPRPGPQSRIGKTPPGQVTGNGGGGGAGGTGRSLQISGVTVIQRRSGTRRSVTVQFLLNTKALATLVLRKGGRTVASKSNKPLAAGLATIRLRVPRSARGGTYRLRLAVVGGAGAPKGYSRNIKIKSLPRRR